MARRPPASTVPAGPSGTPRIAPCVPRRGWVGVSTLPPHANGLARIKGAGGSVTLQGMTSTRGMTSTSSVVE